MIIIKNIFDKISEDTLKKAKNKLDMILTDRQKQEILTKLQGTDRETLLNMMSRMDLSSLSDESVEKLMNNLDAESIADKLNKM